MRVREKLTILGVISILRIQKSLKWHIYIPDYFSLTEYWLRLVFRIHRDLPSNGPERNFLCPLQCLRRPGRPKQFTKDNRNTFPQ